MRNFIKHHWRAALAGTLVLSLLSIGAATQIGQDQTFRLLNLERRVDQLQTRLDYVERAQQTQSLNQSNTANQERVLELQTQVFNQAQQIVHLQKQMLETRKELDRLTERVTAGQKNEKPKEPAPAKPEESGKPKATPRKP